MVKTNLMVFIRPKILRDAEQTYMETNQKYNYIRDVQLGNEGESVPLMPNATRPTLPPLDLREAPTTEETDQPE
jgi:general secretion pathway protein D